MIVVSEKFLRTRFIDRMSEFLKRTGMMRDRKLGVVEAFCYTPEEFERKKKGINIIQEALRSGRLLYKKKSHSKIN